VITRLAEYSPKEAYRVLKPGTYFFRYGLRPKARKEARKFFPNRIDKGVYPLSQKSKELENEGCKDIKRIGFIVTHLRPQGD